MRKVFGLLLLVPVLAAGVASPLDAQTFAGSIQGKVADNAGRPVAGATVYLSSPSMQGQRIVLAGKRGGFDFPGLGPGVYVLVAEMPGFITLVREGILLPSGASRFFRLQLTPSEEETEIKSDEPLPLLDSISSKAAVVQEQGLLRRLPLARDFDDVLSLAPGVVSPGFLFPREAAVLGGTVRDNVYVLDGANLTDLVDSTPLVNLNVDLLEEVEVASAGQPASFIPAGGATVNVVTKSGGDTVSGGLGLYIMNGAFNKKLWTPAEIRDLGTAPPGGDKNLFESALNLGGTFWPDRAWYFLAGRFLAKSQNGVFVGPFRDAEGRLHENYDWSRRDFSGFLKFTIRPTNEARGAIWANLADVYQPVAEDPAARLPFLSTRVLDHEQSLALFATGEYRLKPNTLAFIRGAYIQRTIPTRLQTEAENLAWTDDAGDLYGPLSGADYNANAKRQRLQANAAIRHFAEGILGTTHTLGAGVDFEDGTSSLGWWRADNLRRTLDSRNPNGNFYGDTGLLGFWLCGTTADSTLLKGRTDGLGAYLTDTFFLGRRLTVNLGLRFDWTWGWFPSAYKLESGNPLSLFIGDALISPRLAAGWPDDFPAGFNPYDQTTYAEQKDLISWTAFSPRAGLTFDVFGKGTTVLKASYARTAEALSHRTFLPLHPLYPRDIAVTWLDANGDGRLNEEDEYGLFNLDYRMFSSASLKKRVAEDLKAPATEEFSIGLEQELFGDVTLGLRVLSRTQKNIVEDVLYAPDSGEVWYAADQSAAQKYWIPFTTTVPGTGSFPSETVTLYARSLQAPPAFLQLRNVPELERKYRALEFDFRKRLSHGWQAAGSVVLSKAEGNIGGFAAATAGLTEAADSPNYFINRRGRLDTDRPLQVNLMGSVELPLEFMLSGLVRYQSGRPWQRWVQVLPPAEWSAAKNVERMYYAVNLEASGARREKAWSSFDLRLEKTWRVGSSGRLGLYADVVNLLGFTGSLVGLNDIDRWLPAAEGAGQTGIKYAAPDFGMTSALYGQRTLRFGLKLDF